MKLSSAFPEDVGDVLSEFIEQMCLSHCNYKSHIYTLNLLEQLLQAMELLQDKVLLLSSNG